VWNAPYGYKGKVWQATQIDTISRLDEDIRNTYEDPTVNAVSHRYYDLMRRDIKGGARDSKEVANKRLKLISIVRREVNITVSLIRPVNKIQDRLVLQEKRSPMMTVSPTRRRKSYSPLLPF